MLKKYYWIADNGPMVTMTSNEDHQALVEGQLDLNAELTEKLKKLPKVKITTGEDVKIVKEYTKLTEKIKL